MKNKTHRYSNGEITVLWTPALCTHAGMCVRMLPEVYRVGQRPWIDVRNASTEELKAQIARCPSGALSYVVVGE